MLQKPSRCRRNRIAQHLVNGRQIGGDHFPEEETRSAYLCHGEAYFIPSVGRQYRRTHNSAARSCSPNGRRRSSGGY